MTRKRSGKKTELINNTMGGSALPFESRQQSFCQMLKGAHFLPFAIESAFVTCQAQIQHPELHSWRSAKQVKWRYSISSYWRPSLTLQVLSIASPSVQNKVVA